MSFEIPQALMKIHRNWYVKARTATAEVTSKTGEKVNGGS